MAMKTVRLAAMSLLLSPLLIPMGAFAQDTDDPRGFYIGAGAGYSSISLEDDDSPADLEGDDVGFKAILGYRILKWVAVEASYADYGTQDDDLFGVAIESDFDAYYLTGVGMLPLGNADIFVKAGIARWEGTLSNPDFGVLASEDNTDAIVGFGAQARFGQLALRGELEGLMLGFDDDGDDQADGDDWIAFISLSVAYTF
jgi:hypothetical protein